MFGLLWFDDDKDRALEEKIAQAAARYQEKYDAAPNVCFVNPSEEVGAVNLDGIALESVKWVLSHHYLVGVEQQ